MCLGHLVLLSLFKFGTNYAWSSLTVLTLAVWVCPVITKLCFVTCPKVQYNTDGEIVALFIL